MKYEIKLKEEKDEALSYLLSFLPKDLGTSLIGFCFEKKYKAINEIRIKKDAFIYLIADSKNVKTDIYVSDSSIDEIFQSLCHGSVYAHIETIKDGYISVGQGIRAGVCGSAVLEGKTIVGIKDVSSINIRIPQKIDGASSYIYNLLEKTSFQKSILLYSPPGIGKTSILRDLVIKLGNQKSPIRFAVIDSREEIITPYSQNANCDAYISYPKGLAIEQATKSMTPQLIICDEISSEQEANAILKASHSGVKLIATTHASRYEELDVKSIIKPLINSGIFDYFIGVERKYGEKTYKFTLNEHKAEV